MWFDLIYVITSILLTVITINWMILKDKITELEKQLLIAKADKDKYKLWYEIGVEAFMKQKELLKKEDKC